MFMQAPMNKHSTLWTVSLMIKNTMSADSLQKGWNYHSELAKQTTVEDFVLETG